MLRRRPRLVALTATVAALVALPGTASAAQSALLQAAGTKPEGFNLSGRQAIRVAASQPTVRKLARKDGKLTPRTGIQLGGSVWQVSFYSGQDEVARAFVDGKTGKLTGPVYTGHDVLWPSARGVRNAFTDRLDWTTLALSLLFLLPFVDPRRPFRLLHLDLLAFLAFEVSFLLQETHHLEASVSIRFAPLFYLLGRLTWMGFRGRAGSRPGPLIPYASDRVLAIGLVALVAVRLVWNVFWSTVGDVGYAGLFGADGLLTGYPLYAGNAPHLDSYGPVNYFFYIPFEVLFPLGPGWSHHNTQGAHVASAVLDLAAVVMLMLLGRKFVRGGGGRRLGLALGWAWAAYPLTFYVLAVNSNDAMIAIFVLGALLAYGSVVGRGLILGLGAATKFTPLALVPIFGLGRERSLRSAVAVAAIAVGVFVAVFAPYVRESGLDTVWNRTIGFQMNRASPFTPWGLHPSLEWMHVVIQAMTIGLIAAASWWPRERTIFRMAALSGAAMIALQMAGTYWSHTYVAWLAAPAWLAIFSQYSLAGSGREPTPRHEQMTTSATWSSGPRQRLPG